MPSQRPPASRSRKSLFNVKTLQYAGSLNCVLFQKVEGKTGNPSPVQKGLRFMVETESPPFGPLTRGRDETGQPDRLWTGLEPLTHGKGLPSSASSGLYGVGVPHTRQGHARLKNRRRPLAHPSPHAKGTPDALEQSCLICPDCSHAKGAPEPVGGKPKAFPTACQGNIRPPQYTENRPLMGSRPENRREKRGKARQKG